MCSKCHHSCKTCLDGNSNKDCVSCPGPGFNRLTIVNGECNCVEGFYDNGTD